MNATPANGQRLRVIDHDAAERAAIQAERTLKSPDPWPALDVAGIFAPLEPIKHLIASLDLCPGAPALVAGYGYTRKTLAMQSAALAIAAGLPVWECFASRQGRVLHVDYEQGARLTRERYQRLALGMSVGPSDIGDRLVLVSMPRIYVDAGSDVEPFLLERLTGFDLAIFDSLKAACPSIEENDSSVRRVLDMLNRVSEHTGCIVVVIHHARKPTKDRPGGAKMTIRGSGAIFDACGSVLIFEAEKGEPTRVSHEKARASGRLADDFTLTTLDVELGGDPRAGVLVAASAAPSLDDVADAAHARRQRDKTARVIEQLRTLFDGEAEQTSADAIATKLGKRATDVRAALRLLIESGEVEVSGSTTDRRHKWTGRK